MRQMVAAQHGTSVIEVKLSVASITQAPCYGASVYCTHHRLDSKCIFHYDRNYACVQILIVYIIRLISSYLWIWLTHKIRVNSYQYIRCNSN